MKLIVWCKGSSMNIQLEIFTRKRFSTWVIAGTFFCLMVAGGCATNGNGDVPVSGDPEADQRAEQRVSSESDAKGKDRAPRTLFDRLGGEAGIAKIVDEMTQRVIEDPRVNFERRNVRDGWIGKYEPWDPTPQNIARFKRHMVEFIALAAGGPTNYTGRDLRALHQGMRITNAEFDAMVGDIKVSMDRLGVGTREQRDLLAIIETTRKQIVEER
jgi:hemoglobin